MRLNPVLDECRATAAFARAPEMVGFASGRGAAALGDLKTRRFLCAGAPTTPPARGRLRATIDEAVELALAMRGALPPRVGAGDEIEAVIADQVFRALALGAAGLAVAIPGLATAAGDAGALGAADSAALRAWLDAARSSPIALVFQEADRLVRLLAPVALVELVAEAVASPADSGTVPRTAGAPAEAVASPAMAVASPAMAVASPPEAVASPPEAVASPAMAAAEIVASDLSEALGSAALRIDIALGAGGDVDIALEAPTSRERPDPTPEAPSRLRGVLFPRSSKGKLPQIGDAGRATAAAMPGDEAATARATDTPRLTPALTRRVAPSAGLIAASADPGATPLAPLAAPAEPMAADAPGEGPLPLLRREPRAAPPTRVVHAAEWRALAHELDEGRGPKPVKVVEQLFTTHYTPLLNAALSGEVDAAVRGVVDAWRKSFEHSYREAFSALRVTGKRPSMVFDAPDVAARIARLNGARGVKLVLVDALRFDLGERVTARLRDVIAGRAVLVERALLWAALPTTTTTQLALLGRGPEGLRDGPPGEPEPEISRGRAVATLRRERAGNRELMKLDLVEARLRTAGPPFAERMESIADEVTEVLARFLEGLPPRTLVMVFGDHGFRIAPLGDATGPATQGGSSPEEVLVPAHAWLVGGVH